MNTPNSEQPSTSRQTQDAQPRSLHAVVRCVFGATISSGVFKGESYECGAKAVGDYYDALYKCRRPVCKRHAKVIERGDAKRDRKSQLHYFAVNAEVSHRTPNT